MQGKRWLKVLGAGSLAGLVAAICMTLAMALLRDVLGIATPAELVGDWLAPRLTIDAFFTLLFQYGGYSQLKQLGVTSVLAGQLAVGMIAGGAYAVIVQRQRIRNPDQHARFGIADAGLRFIVLFVTLLWLITLVWLWPVLDTHYAGLPPGRASVVTILGLLCCYGVYGIALLLASRLLTSRPSSRTSGPISEPSGRRAVILGGVGAIAALATGGVLWRLYRRATFSYDGLRYHDPNIQPLAPNECFYVVTKNVIDPLVNRAIWRLEVTGMVDRPHTYRFEDLLAMPATTQETTLECISNGVGGGLLSNARWTGVPLRRFIEAAHPRPGVVKVLLQAADGYTDTITFEKAMEPTTLAAYEMNGVPLPARHGYPVRLIVPGVFGEKHVKWVTRIALLPYAAKGFYERQGWGPNFVIPTCSRFDQPSDGATMQLATAATMPLKGVAFAGARGVQRVEVSVDNGMRWQDATIVYRGSPLAWVLWRYDWRPTQPGDYRLVVRATDGTGALQTPEYRNINPEEATGYHRLFVHLDA